MSLGIIGEILTRIKGHSEGRGFCAGGDIAFLRDSALNDGGKRRIITLEPAGRCAK